MSSRGATPGRAASAASGIAGAAAGYLAELDALEARIAPVGGGRSPARLPPPSPHPAAGASSWDGVLSAEGDLSGLGSDRGDGLGGNGDDEEEEDEEEDWLPEYFASLVEGAREDWVPLPDSAAFLLRGAQRAVDIIYDAVGPVGPPVRPEGGSLFIVDERRLPNWREDGYAYAAMAHEPRNRPAAGIQYSDGSVYGSRGGSGGGGAGAALAASAAASSSSSSAPVTADVLTLTFLQPETPPIPLPLSASRGPAAPARLPGGDFAEQTLVLEWSVVERSEWPAGAAADASGSQEYYMQRRAVRLPRVGGGAPVTAGVAAALSPTGRAQAGGGAPGAGWIWLVQYLPESLPPRYTPEGIPIQPKPQQQQQQQQQQAVPAAVEAKEASGPAAAGGRRAPPPVPGRAPPPPPSQSLLAAAAPTSPEADDNLARKYAELSAELDALDRGIAEHTGRGAKADGDGEEAAAAEAVGPVYPRAGAGAADGDADGSGIDFAIDDGEILAALAAGDGGSITSPQRLRGRSSGPTTDLGSPGPLPSIPPVPVLVPPTHTQDAALANSQLYHVPGMSVHSHDPTQPAVLSPNRKGVDPFAPTALSRSPRPAAVSAASRGGAAVPAAAVSAPAATAQWAMNADGDLVPVDGSTDLSTFAAGLSGAGGDGGGRRSAAVSFASTAPDEFDYRVAPAPERVEEEDPAAAARKRAAALDLQRKRVALAHQLRGSPPPPTTTALAQLAEAADADVAPSSVASEVSSEESDDDSVAPVPFRAAAVETDGEDGAGAEAGTAPVSADEGGDDEAGQEYPTHGREGTLRRGPADDYSSTLSPESGRDEEVEEAVVHMSPPRLSRPAPASEAAALAAAPPHAPPGMGSYAHMHAEELTLRRSLVGTARSAAPAPAAASAPAPAEEEEDTAAAGSYAGLHRSRLRSGAGPVSDALDGHRPTAAAPSPAARLRPATADVYRYSDPATYGGTRASAGVDVDEDDDGSPDLPLQDGEIEGGAYAEDEEEERERATAAAYAEADGAADAARAHRHHHHGAPVTLPAAATAHVPSSAPAPAPAPTAEAAAPSSRRRSSREDKPRGDKKKERGGKGKEEGRRRGRSDSRSTDTRTRSSSSSSSSTSSSKRDERRRSSRHRSSSGRGKREGSRDAHRSSRSRSGRRESSSRNASRHRSRRSHRDSDSYDSSSSRDDRRGRRSSQPRYGRRHSASPGRRAAAPKHLLPPTVPTAYVNVGGRLVPVRLPIGTGGGLLAAPPAPAPAAPVSTLQAEALSIISEQTRLGSVREAAQNLRASQIGGGGIYGQGAGMLGYGGAGGGYGSLAGGYRGSYVGGAGGHLHGSMLGGPGAGGFYAQRQQQQQPSAPYGGAYGGGGYGGGAYGGGGFGGGGGPYGPATAQPQPSSGPYSPPRPAPSDGPYGPGAPLSPPRRDVGPYGPQATEPEEAEEENAEQEQQQEEEPPQKPAPRAAVASPALPAQARRRAAPPVPQAGDDDGAAEAEGEMRGADDAVASGSGGMGGTLGGTGGGRTAKVQRSPLAKSIPVGARARAGEKASASAGSDFANDGSGELTLVADRAYAPFCAGRVPDLLRALLLGWRVRTLLKLRKIRDIRQRVLDAQRLLADAGSGAAAADAATPGEEGADTFTAGIRTQLDAELAELSRLFVGNDGANAIGELTSFLRAQLRAKKGKPFKGPLVGSVDDDADAEAAARGAKRAAERKARLKGGAVGKAVMAKYSKIPVKEGGEGGSENGDEGTGGEADAAPAAPPEKPWLKARGKKPAGAGGPGGSGPPEDVLVVAPPKKRGGAGAGAGAAAGGGSEGAAPKDEEDANFGSSLAPSGKWRILFEVLSAKNLAPALYAPGLLAAGPGLKAEVSADPNSLAPDPDARDSYAVAYLAKQAGGAPGAPGPAPSRGGRRGSVGGGAGGGAAALDGSERVTKVVGKKVQTTVAPKTLAPTWKKRFVFALPVRIGLPPLESIPVDDPGALAEVADAPLRLEEWEVRVDILDSDRYVRDTFMGGAAIRLSDMPTAAGKTVWLALAAQSSADRVRGQVCVRYRLVPPVHDLRVGLLNDELAGGGPGGGAADGAAAAAAAPGRGLGGGRPRRASGGGDGDLDEDGGGDGLPSSTFLRRKSTNLKAQNKVNDYSHVQAKTVSRPEDARGGKTASQHRPGGAVRMYKMPDYSRVRPKVDDGKGGEDDSGPVAGGRASSIGAGGGRRRSTSIGRGSTGGGGRRGSGDDGGGGAYDDDGGDGGLHPAPRGGRGARASTGGGGPAAERAGRTGRRKDLDEVEGGAGYTRYVSYDNELLREAARALGEPIPADLGAPPSQLPRPGKGGAASKDKGAAQKPGAATGGGRPRAGSSEGAPSGAASRITQEDMRRVFERGLRSSAGPPTQAPSQGGRGGGGAASRLPRDMGGAVEYESENFRGDPSLWLGQDSIVGNIVGPESPAPVRGGRTGGGGGGGYQTQLSAGAARLSSVGGNNNNNPPVSGIPIPAGSRIPRRDAPAAPAGGRAGGAGTANPYPPSSASADVMDSLGDAIDRFFDNGPVTDPAADFSDYGFVGVGGGGGGGVEAGRFLSGGRPSYNVPIPPPGAYSSRGSAAAGGGTTAPAQQTMRPSANVSMASSEAATSRDFRPVTYMQSARAAAAAAAAASPPASSSSALLSPELKSILFSAAPPADEAAGAGRKGGGLPSQSTIGELTRAAIAAATSSSSALPSTAGGGGGARGTGQVVVSDEAARFAAELRRSMETGAGAGSGGGGVLLSAAPSRPSFAAYRG
jgi:hypothetical protein